MGAQLPLEFRITGFSDAGSEMKRIADLANRIAEQAGRPIALPSISAPGAVAGSGEQAIVPGRPETYTGAALQGARQMEQARQAGIESGYDGIAAGDRAGQKAADASARSFIAEFERAVKASGEAQGLTGRELRSNVEQMVREMKTVFEAATREMAGIFGGENGLRTQARNLMMQDAPQSVGLTVDPGMIQRIAQETYAAAARATGTATPAVSVAQGATTQPVATGPIEPVVYRQTSVPPQVDPRASLPQTPSQSAIRDNARAQQDEERAARLRRQTAQEELKLQEMNLQKVRSMVIEGQRTIVNAATNQPVPGYTPVPESPAARTAAISEVRRINSQLRQRYDQQVSEVQTEVKTAPAQAIAPIVEQVTGQPMEMVSQMPSRSNPAPRQGPSPAGITQAGGTGGPSNGKGRTVGSPRQRVIAELAIRYRRPSQAPAEMRQTLERIFSGGMSEVAIPDDASPEMRRAMEDDYKRERAALQAEIDQNLPFLKDLGFNLEDLQLGRLPSSKATREVERGGHWVDRNGDIITTKKKGRDGRPAGSPILSEAAAKRRDPQARRAGWTVTEQVPVTAPAREWRKAIKEDQWPEGGLKELAKWRDRDGNPVEPGMLGDAYPDKSVGPAPRSISSEKKRRRTKPSTSQTLPPLPPDPEPETFGVPAEDYGTRRKTEPTAPKPLTRAAADKLIAKLQGSKPLGGQKPRTPLSSAQQRLLRTLGVDEFGQPLPVSSIDADLADMKANELRSLAPQYGLKGSGKGVTEDYLRRAIQDMRDAGVQPATAAGSGRGAEPPSTPPPTPAPTPDGGKPRLTKQQASEVLQQLTGKKSSRKIKDPDAPATPAQLAAIERETLARVAQSQPSGSLVGADTDWIEDFIIRQSYASDIEAGREPSNLVKSYMEQTGEVPPVGPVGVPASEYGKGRSLKTEGKSSDDILAGIAGRALEVQPDVGYSSWKPQDLINHLRARRASLSKEVRKAHGIPATAKGNRKTKTYIRDLERLDQLGLATGIAPPPGAGKPLTPEEVIDQQVSAAVKGMDWQQVLAAGSTAGLGIDPDGSQIVGRTKLEEYLKKGALDQLKRQKKATPDPGVEAEVKAAAEQTGAAVAQSVAPSSLTRGQARAVLEQLGRTYSTPIKNPDAPALPIQIRAIEQASAEANGTAKPKPKPYVRPTGRSELSQQISDDLGRAWGRDAAIPASSTVRPVPYTPEEARRILARRSRSYGAGRSTDGERAVGIDPIQGPYAEEMARREAVRLDRLKQVKVDAFGRPVDSDGNVLRPEDQYSKEWYEQRATGRAPVYGVGERIIGGPTDRERLLAEQRAAAISQFGVAPPGYTGPPRPGKPGLTAEEMINAREWDLGRLVDPYTGKPVGWFAELQRRVARRVQASESTPDRPAGPRGVSGSTQPQFKIAELLNLAPGSIVGEGTPYAVREAWKSTETGSVFDNTLEDLLAKQAQGLTQREIREYDKLRARQGYNNERMQWVPGKGKPLSVAEKSRLARLAEKKRQFGLSEAEERRVEDFRVAMERMSPEQRSAAETWRAEQRARMQEVVGEGADLPASWALEPAAKSKLTGGEWEGIPFLFDTEMRPAQGFDVFPTTGNLGQLERFATEEEALAARDRLVNPPSTRGRSRKRYPRGSNAGDNFEIMRGRKPSRYGRYESIETGEVLRHKGRGRKAGMPISYKEPKKGHSSAYPGYKWVNAEETATTAAEQAERARIAEERRVAGIESELRSRAEEFTGWRSPEIDRLREARNAIFPERELLKERAELTNPEHIAALDEYIGGLRSTYEPQLAQIDASIEEYSKPLREEWIKSELAKATEFPGVGLPGELKGAQPFMVRPLAQPDEAGNRFITTSFDPTTGAKVRFQSEREAYEYIARRQLEAQGQIGQEVPLTAPPSNQLTDLSKVKLQELARAVGVPISGTKAEIAERIRSADLSQLNSKPRKAKAGLDKGELGDDEYAKDPQTQASLTSAAKLLGLPTTGTKPELIERITGRLNPPETLPSVEELGFQIRQNVGGISDGMFQVFRGKKTVGLPFARREEAEAEARRAATAFLENQKISELAPNLRGAAGERKEADGNWDAGQTAADVERALQGRAWLRRRSGFDPLPGETPNASSLARRRSRFGEATMRFLSQDGVLGDTTLSPEDAAWWKDRREAAARGEGLEPLGLPKNPTYMQGVLAAVESLISDRAAGSARNRDFATFGSVRGKGEDAEFILQRIGEGGGRANELEADRLRRLQESGPEGALIAEQIRNGTFKGSRRDVATGYSSGVQQTELSTPEGLLTGSKGRVWNQLLSLSPEDFATVQMLSGKGYGSALAALERNGVADFGESALDLASRTPSPRLGLGPRNEQEQTVFNNLRARNRADAARGDTSLFESSKRLIAAADDSISSGQITPADLQAYSRLAGSKFGAPLAPVRMRELLALAAAGGEVTPDAGPAQLPEATLARLAGLQDQIPGLAGLVQLYGRVDTETVNRLRSSDPDVQRRIQDSIAARASLANRPTAEQQLLAGGWFEGPPEQGPLYGPPVPSALANATGRTYRNQDFYTGNRDTGDIGVKARAERLLQQRQAQVDLEAQVNAQLSLADNPAKGAYNPAFNYELVAGKYERVLTPLQQKALDLGLDPATIDKSLKAIKNPVTKGRELGFRGVTGAQLEDLAKSGGLLADTGFQAVDVEASTEAALAARALDPNALFPAPTLLEKFGGRKIEDGVVRVKRNLNTDEKLIKEAQKVSELIAADREYAGNLALLQPELGDVQAGALGLPGSSGPSFEELQKLQEAEAALGSVYGDPAKRAQELLRRTPFGRGEVADQVSLATAAVERGRQARGTLEGDLQIGRTLSEMVPEPPVNNAAEQRAALAASLYEEGKRFGGRTRLADQTGPRGTRRPSRKGIQEEVKKLRAKLSDVNIPPSEKGADRARLNELLNDPRMRPLGTEPNDAPGVGFRQLASDIVKDLGYGTRGLSGKNVGKVKAYGPDGEIGIFESRRPQPGAEGPVLEARSLAQSAVLLDAIRSGALVLPTSSTMGGFLPNVGITDEDIVRSFTEGTPLQVQTKLGGRLTSRQITAGEEFGLLAAAAAEAPPIAFTPTQASFGDPVQPIEVARDLRQLSDPRTAQTPRPVGSGFFQLAPENTTGGTRPDSYKESFQSAMLQNRQAALANLENDLRLSGKRAAEATSRQSRNPQTGEMEDIIRSREAYRDPVLARLADLGVDPSYFSFFGDQLGLSAVAPQSRRSGRGLLRDAGTYQRQVLGLTGRGTRTTPTANPTVSARRRRTGPGLGVGGGAGLPPIKPPTGGTPSAEPPEDPFDKVRFGPNGKDASGRNAINLTQAGQEALVQMAMEAGAAGIPFEDFYDQMEADLLERATPPGATPEEALAAQAAVTRAANVAAYSHELGRKGRVAAGGAGGGGGGKKPPSAAGAADEPPKNEGKRAKRRRQAQEQATNIRDKWRVGGWSDLDYGIDKYGNVTVGQARNVKPIENFFNEDGETYGASQFAYSTSWEPSTSDLAGGPDFDRLKRLAFEQRNASKNAANRRNVREPMVPAFDAAGNPIMKTVKAGTAKYDAEGNYIPGTEKYIPTNEQRMIPEWQQQVTYTGPDGLPVTGMMGKRGSKGGYWASPEGLEEEGLRLMAERQQIRRAQMQQEARYNALLLEDVQALAQIAEIRAAVGLDPSVVQSRANTLVSNLQGRNAVGDAAAQNPAFTPAMNQEGMRRFIESRKRAGRNAEAEELENIYKSSLPLPDKLDEFNNTKLIQQREQLRARQDQEDPLAKLRAEERKLAKDKGYTEEMLVGSGKGAKLTPAGEEFLKQRSETNARMMVIDQMLAESTEKQAAAMGLNTKKKGRGGRHGMNKSLEEIGEQLHPGAMVQNAVGMMTWMLPMQMTFGIIGFLKETLETSLEIEKAYRKTQNQFQLAYGPQAQGYLNQFNAKVVEIAKSTNMPQVKLNEVGRSIVASFGPKSGVELQTGLSGGDKLSGMDLANEQLQAVAEFSYVTGREPEKVKDEFQSIGLAWGLGGRAAGDLLIAAEQSYGVKPDTLSQGVADSSTVAAASGFKAEEWTALIAETERRAGSRSAVAVSESMNRALTDVPRKSKELLDLRETLPALQGGAFDKAFATGDTAGLLTAIADIAADIKREQDQRRDPLWRKGEQDLIVTTLGSERNDKDFWAGLSALSAIRSGTDATYLSMLSASSKDGLQSRYEDTQTSLKGQIDSMIGSITATFVSLSKTGLIEVLAGFAKVGASALKGVESLVSGFLWINEKSRGLGKALIELAVVAKVLQFAFTRMAAMQVADGARGPLAWTGRQIARAGVALGGDRATVSPFRVLAGNLPWREQATAQYRTSPEFIEGMAAARLARASRPGFWGRVTRFGRGIDEDKVAALRGEQALAAGSVSLGTFLGEEASDVVASRRKESSVASGRRKSVWQRAKARFSAARRRMSPFDSDGNIGGQGGYLDISRIFGGLFDRHRGQDTTVFDPREALVVGPVQTAVGQDVRGFFRRLRRGRHTMAPWDLDMGGDGFPIETDRMIDEGGDHWPSNYPRNDSEGGWSGNRRVGAGYEDPIVRRRKHLAGFGRNRRAEWRWMRNRITGLDYEGGLASKWVGFGPRAADAYAHAADDLLRAHPATVRTIDQIGSMGSLFPGQEEPGLLGLANPGSVGGKRRSPRRFFRSLRNRGVDGLWREPVWNSKIGVSATADYYKPGVGTLAHEFGHQLDFNAMTGKGADKYQRQIQEIIDAETTARVARAADRQRRQPSFVNPFDGLSREEARLLTIENLISPYARSNPRELIAEATQRTLGFGEGSPNRLSTALYALAAAKSGADVSPRAIRKLRKKLWKWQERSGVPFGTSMKIDARMEAQRLAWSDERGLPAPSAPRPAVDLDELRSVNAELDAKRGFGPRNLIPVRSPRSLPSVLTPDSVTSGSGVTVTAADIAWNKWQQQNALENLAPPRYRGLTIGQSWMAPSEILADAALLAPVGPRGVFARARAYARSRWADRGQLGAIRLPGSRRRAAAAAAAAAEREVANLTTRQSIPVDQDKIDEVFGPRTPFKLSDTDWEKTAASRLAAGEVPKAMDVERGLMRQALAAGRGQGLRAGVRAVASGLTGKGAGGGLLSGLSALVGAGSGGAGGVGGAELLAGGLGGGGSALTGMAAMAGPAIAIGAVLVAASKFASWRNSQDEAAKKIFNDLSQYSPAEIKVARSKENSWAQSIRENGFLGGREKFASIAERAYAFADGRKQDAAVLAAASAYGDEYDVSGGEEMLRGYRLNDQSFSVKTFRGETKENKAWWKGPIAWIPGVPEQGLKGYENASKWINNASDIAKFRRTRAELRAKIFEANPSARQAVREDQYNKYSVLLAEGNLQEIQKGAEKGEIGAAVALQMARDEIRRSGSPEARDALREAEKPVAKELAKFDKKTGKPLDLLIQEYSTGAASSGQILEAIKSAEKQLNDMQREAIAEGGARPEFAAQIAEYRKKEMAFYGQMVKQNQASAKNNAKLFGGASVKELASQAVADGFKNMADPNLSTEDRLAARDQLYNDIQSEMEAYVRGDNPLEQNAGARRRRFLAYQKRGFTQEQTKSLVTGQASDIVQGTPSYIATFQDITNDNGTVTTALAQATQALALAMMPKSAGGTGELYGVTDPAKVQEWMSQQIVERSNAQIAAADAKIAEDKASGAKLDPSWNAYLDTIEADAKERAARNLKDGQWFETAPMKENGDFELGGQAVRRWTFDAASNSWKQTGGGVKYHNSNNEGQSMSKDEGLAVLLGGAVPSDAGVAEDTYVLGKTDNGFGGGLLDLLNQQAAAARTAEENRLIGAGVLGLVMPEYNSKFELQTARDDGTLRKPRTYESKDSGARPLPVAGETVTYYGATYTWQPGADGTDASGSFVIDPDKAGTTTAGGVERLDSFKPGPLSTAEGRAFAAVAAEGRQPGQTYDGRAVSWADVYEGIASGDYTVTGAADAETRRQSDLFRYNANSELAANETARQEAIARRDAELRALNPDDPGYESSARNINANYDRVILGYNQFEQAKNDELDRQTQLDDFNERMQLLQINGQGMRSADTSYDYATKGKNSRTMSAEQERLRANIVDQQTLVNEYSKVVDGEVTNPVAAAQSAVAKREAEANLAAKIREQAAYEHNLNFKVKGQDRRAVIIAAYAALNGITDETLKMQLEDIKTRKKESLAEAWYQASIGNDEAAEQALNEYAKLVAEEANKQREIRQKLRGELAARSNMIVAALSYHGDLVGVAQEQLRADQAILADMLANKQDFSKEQIDNQQAKITNDAAAVRQAQFQKQTNDIDFALTLGQITTGQAIKELEAMRILYADNEQMTREIDLKIHQLKGSMDLQYNLPDLLYLPKFYDARRVTQYGAGGDQSYMGGTDWFPYQEAMGFGATLNTDPNAPIYPSMSPQELAARQVELASQAVAAAAGVTGTKMTYDQFKAANFDPNLNFTADMKQSPIDGSMINASDYYYQLQYLASMYPSGSSDIQARMAQIGTQNIVININNPTSTAEVVNAITGVLDPTRTVAAQVNY